MEWAGSAVAAGEAAVLKELNAAPAGQKGAVLVAIVNRKILHPCLKSVAKPDGRFKNIPVQILQKKLTIQGRAGKCLIPFFLSNRVQNKFRKLRLSIFQKNILVSRLCDTGFKIPVK